MHHKDSSTNLPVVMVDANLIVRRDWHLAKPQWAVLLGLAATGQIRLVVPELVVAETVGRFADALNTPTRELRKLGLSIDRHDAVQDFETSLRKTLDAPGVECPAHDPISVSELAKRAIGRLRPFDENGNGFRDSILWAYALELLRGSKRLILISNDGDFCHGKGDDRSLHPDLAAEAAATAPDATIAWFPDIGRFLNSTGRSRHLEIEARVLKLLSSQFDPIRQRIETAVQDAEVFVQGDDRISIEVDAVNGLHEFESAVVDLPQAGDSYIVRFRFVASLNLGVERRAGNLSWQIGNVRVDSVPIEIDAFFDDAAYELSGFTAAMIEVDVERVLSEQNEAIRKMFDTDALKGLTEQNEAIRKMFDTDALKGLTEQNEAIRKMFDTDALKGLTEQNEAIRKMFDTDALKGLTEQNEAIRKMFDTDALKGLTEQNEAIRKMFDTDALKGLTEQNEAIRKMFDTDALKGLTEQNEAIRKMFDTDALKGLTEQNDAIRKMFDTDALKGLTEQNEAIRKMFDTDALKGLTEQNESPWSIAEEE